MSSTFGVQHFQLLCVLEVAGDGFCCSIRRRKSKHLLLMCVLVTFCQKLNKVNSICANALPGCDSLFSCTLALLGSESELWCGHEGSNLIAHGHPWYQLKGNRPSGAIPRLGTASNEFLSLLSNSQLYKLSCQELPPATDLILPYYL